MRRGANVDFSPSLKPCSSRLVTFASLLTPLALKPLALKSLVLTSLLLIGGCNTFGVAWSVLGCDNDLDCEIRFECQEGACKKLVPDPREFNPGSVDGGGDLDAGSNADAGPPVPPEILSFEVWGPDPGVDAGIEFVSDAGVPVGITPQGVLEYGSKPGFSWSAVGVNSCRLRIPGASTRTGKEFVTREFGPNGRGTAVREGNVAVIFDTEATLTCARISIDENVLDAGVEERTRPIRVRCVAPEDVINVLLALDNYDPNANEPNLMPGPHCQSVLGDLTISGARSALTDGGGPQDVLLAHIYRLDGSLLVLDNDGLTHIPGLVTRRGSPHLTSIGGGLVLDNNPNLVDLSALAGLDIVGVDTTISSTGEAVSLWLNENDLLTDLSPLSLTSALGSVVVTSNDMLGVDGGPAGALIPSSALININGGLLLENNDELASLEFLANLVAVTGALIINSNPSLVDATLPSLQSVGEAIDPIDAGLSVIFNDALATVAAPALNSLTGRIDVRGSTSLSSFQVGGPGTVWNGESFVLQQAQQPSIDDACARLSEWTVVGTGTRVGQLAQTCPN